MSTPVIKDRGIDIKFLSIRIISNGIIIICPNKQILNPTIFPVRCLNKLLSGDFNILKSTPVLKK
jgi:hypothetical protein